MYQKENLPELLEKYHYKNITLKNKNVLLRSCLNVSIDDFGNIDDDTRLREALPVIKDIAERSDNLTIVGHLGRPDMTSSLSMQSSTKKFSLKNVAQWFNKKFKEESFNYEVVLLNSIDEIYHRIHTIKPEERKIYLLENIRFDPAEESKHLDERWKLALELSKLGDIFVNDAFPDYRESASTYDIAKVLPAYIGTAFYEEVKALSKFSDPEKPFVAVLGGAKLSEKLDAMESLLKIADTVIVGGAMAYTLLKAKGIETGKSLIEEDKLQVAQSMIETYGDKILLPIDHIIAEKFDEDQEFTMTSGQEIPQDMIAVDIGDKTIALYCEAIAAARSLLVNGPEGVFEWEETEKGTREIFSAIVANKDAYKLAGGGDSISAIHKFHIEHFDHISTGGGAMLAFLAYEKFPVLDVILRSV